MNCIDIYPLTGYAVVGVAVMEFLSMLLKLKLIGVLRGVTD